MGQTLGRETQTDSNRAPAFPMVSDDLGHVPSPFRAGQNVILAPGRGREVPILLQLAGPSHFLPQGSVSQLSHPPSSDQGANYQLAEALGCALLLAVWGWGGQSMDPAHTAGFPTPRQLPCSPLSPPPAPPLTAANFRTYRRRGRRAGLQLSRSRRSVGLGFMSITPRFSLCLSIT